jgi:hypothetical protein
MGESFGSSMTVPACLGFGLVCALGVNGAAAYSDMCVLVVGRRRRKLTSGLVYIFLVWGIGRKRFMEELNNCFIFWLLILVCGEQVENEGRYVLTSNSAMEEQGRLENRAFEFIDICSLGGN